MYSPLCINLSLCRHPHDLVSYFLKSVEQTSQMFPQSQRHSQIIPLLDFFFDFFITFNFPNR